MLRSVGLMMICFAFTRFGGLTTQPLPLVRVASARAVRFPRGGPTLGSYCGSITTRFLLGGQENRCKTRNSDEHTA